MHRAPLFLLCALGWAGCGRLPESFPPPEQRASIVEPGREPGANGLGPAVAMSDPNAGLYIVQGFRDQRETSWRWAHDHPVLRFYLPDVGAVKFTLDFTLPDATFRETGPVTLSFAINGKPFDRVRFDKPGEQHYRGEVPAALVRPNGINTVAMDPDKCAHNGGERLGFVLSRAGFTE